MLFIITALACEAKPIIEYYRLIADSEGRPFPVYRNEDICLVISGMGKIVSAMAVTYIHTILGEKRNNCWMNVGIAGHDTLPLGSWTIVNKIIDGEKTWYPMVPRIKATTTLLYTVDKPEKDFVRPGAYDMEASGFYAAAVRFSTSELVQCLKVVSDGPGDGVVSPELATQVISDNMNAVDTLAKVMMELSLEGHVVAEDPLPMLQRYHFTVTQQHQLRRLLAQWKVVYSQEYVYKYIEKCASAKEIISVLQGKITSSCLELYT